MDAIASKMIKDTSTRAEKIWSACRVPIWTGIVRAIDCWEPNALGELHVSAFHSMLVQEVNYYRAVEQCIWDAAYAQYDENEFELPFSTGLCWSYDFSEFWYRFPPMNRPVSDFI